MTLGGRIEIEEAQKVRDEGRWWMVLISIYLGRGAIYQLWWGDFTYVDNVPQAILRAPLHICPVESPDLMTII